MKHTKGTWEVKSYLNYGTEIRSGKMIICRDTINEDAQLISAAPEMYEALETIIKKLQKQGDASLELGRCMNAVAKARGVKL